MQFKKKQRKKNMLPVRFETCQLNTRQAPSTVPEAEFLKIMPVNG